MPPHAATWIDWLRRQTRWSNTRQSWEERLGTLALVLAAVAAYVWSGRLTLTQNLFLWGSLLVALAFLGRRGWLKLFGPVLFYDLVTTARRRRYFLIRSAYICVLAVILCWMFLVYWTGWNYRGGATVKDTAAFAEAFFYTFIILQLVVVVVLTPAYTAGTIADEKDRKTLEFLLATDLRNREIVLSKMATRLLNLTMLVLAGLPIFSFTQFFGGVDPNLLLVSYAALGLTMLSLAGVSMLSSVLMKKPRDAIVLTYLAVVAYVGLSTMLFVLMFIPGVAPFLLGIGGYGVSVGEVSEWLAAGNLLVAIIRLAQQWGARGGGLADILPDLLGKYAMFHGLVALVATTWAVARLRVIALRQSYGKAQKQPLKVRMWGRPGVGNLPMLWKEVIAEPGLKFGWIGRIAVLLLIIGSFIWPGIIIAEYIRGILQGPGPRGGMFGFRNPWEQMGEMMNIWIRILGTGAACLMLLAVAVRASGVVSGERDRQTLDGLLTTPMGANTILFAKWLGSIVSVRWAWLWLGAMWLLALVTGGLSPLAVPILPIAWLIYAAFFASVGLFFSVVSRTSLRSTMGTLVTVVALSVGHWLVSSLCCFMPLAVLANVRGRTVENLMMMEFGQSPPLVLGLFAFQGDEFENVHTHRETMNLIASSFFGLIVWACAAGGVWALANLRFRVITGRTPYTPVVAAEVVPLQEPPAKGQEAITASVVGNDKIVPLPGVEREG